jgi:hypothetical protein
MDGRGDVREREREERERDLEPQKGPLISPEIHLILAFVRVGWYWGGVGMPSRVVSHAYTLSTKKALPRSYHHCSSCGFSPWRSYVGFSEHVG